jgi:cell wall assembly regulator SMI1
MTFRKLETLLRSYPDNSLGTGATEEEIQRAERNLGLRIVGTYRDFFVNLDGEVFRTLSFMVSALECQLIWTL